MLSLPEHTEEVIVWSARTMFNIKISNYLVARISNICVPRQVVTIFTSIPRLSGKHFHFETTASCACYLPINIQFMALHFDYLYNFISRQWWLHVVTRIYPITTKLKIFVIFFSDAKVFQWETLKAECWLKQCKEECHRLWRFWPQKAVQQCRGVRHSRILLSKRSQ